MHGLAGLVRTGAGWRGLARAGEGWRGLARAGEGACSFLGSAGRSVILEAGVSVCRCSVRNSTLPRDVDSNVSLLCGMAVVHRTSEHTRNGNCLALAGWICSAEATCASR